MLRHDQGGLVAAAPGASVRRVSQACARCRRQKLKCDVTKPCTMCVRSGMECHPRPVLKSTKKRKASIAPQRESSGAKITRTPPTPASQSPGSVEHSESNHTLLSRVSNGISPTQAAAETQQFGVNRSAISLAMNMYESLGTQAPTNNSTIPGDASPFSPRGPTWSLHSMAMPTPTVIETLTDVYFNKMHWFIWILHKPSFLIQVRQVISATSWQRDDMGKVLITLMVAAVGLKCAMQDTSPQGQQLLMSISPNPQGLVDQMIAEVRIHLLDLLDDSCIETVQVCLLLGAFYIFHGSPSLAWATIGLSVRASYALALHCEPQGDVTAASQVRRRCWNHLTVADTFASQIYGRPASLDPAFSDLLPLANVEDANLGILNDLQDHESPEANVTAMSFHWHKYRLYEVIRKTLSTFRLLRLHNPMTPDELRSLIDAVEQLYSQLKEWRETLPALLVSYDLPDDQTRQAQGMQRPHDHQADVGHDGRCLRLQACLLQITYDAAIILVHRPLLEYKLSSEARQGVSKSSMESVSRSFDVSVKAALRISRAPVMQFRHEFCMAFVFIHLFTAGVILCIPPTSHPFTAAAQEAKTGVFRIIKAAKTLSPHSQIARHTERLLSDLLKLSLHREVDIVFKEERRLDTRSTSRLSPAEDTQLNEAQNLINLSAKHNDSFTQREANTDHYGRTSSPYLSGLNIERTVPPLQQELEHRAIGDDWAENQEMFTDFENAEDPFQPLDLLPLDEAFGAFGQVMFNLMPDDPLNSWGWGKSSM